MSQTLTVPTFTLENGTTLRDVPVAYRTWGTLNATGTNAVLVCHALTGDTNVADWWGGLLGPGRALDPTEDFVVCLNVPGSPYGSVAPVTVNPDTGERYGAGFPPFTTRDTVRLHRRALETLGVQRVACAVGGSMGGMHVLEWAFEATDGGAPFVRSLVPIAVGGRHTAWQIGWGAAQRQAIFADPKWRDGTYPPDDPPTNGLATARMMAMVSYRSRPSLDGRFGRDAMPEQDGTPYAVESYLHHHGNKLVDRFDANCYVALTRQMDTHDVARGRGDYAEVLRGIEQPSLVVGIDSDVLYPLSEQEELAEHLPSAALEVLSAPHGHDTFLIELDALNDLVSTWRANICSSVVA
ncbi:homoserine O-acetyltransferase MetX [Salinibacter ruber]|uniref:Homoserine O-acetyltransferase n=1 Tax=Salinibacter ruber TaxID=146919 RepID=A0A9X2U750_9BACT|nr:homoserine O-acetyltransferase [Salinibacter ruber]MCS3655432.1 homoserine O-acetyltransferase [Salinibacter ruber]MCS3951044.1 homoserine O-acetyltransferase [Salinibacter ruber]MCS4116590.1 homoserine O-acetyltransferase [Salinibacter ruber]MCS4152991.1 homoserine O-acetyltransferase [Salinibacter ruber]MCS4168805.1 homoserine O-acetyltransferase [Salinibacter ruber]